MVFFRHFCYNFSLSQQGDITWSWKEFIKAVFPVKGNAYWFATMYIGLYLLHPYLNRMIIGLEQADARKLLYCLIFLFSI